MHEHKESGERELYYPSSIVFANEDLVEQAREQLREYEELEEMFKVEHPRLQVGMYGPVRLVGIFKTVIMTFAIAHAETYGYQKPILLRDVLRECREKSTFSIEGAEEINYISNPHIDTDDKERLGFYPDFSAISGDSAEVKAFYESLYTFQKFARGIREDVIGGSEFVDPPKTPEDFKDDLGTTALRGIPAEQE